MLRRLLAFVILVALVLGGLFYWRLRHGGRLPAGGRPVAAFEDAATTLSVKTALGLVRSLKPYDVEVSTEEGVVTLRGQLPSSELRALAERTAAAVPDVRQVVNHVKVTPGIERADGNERTLGESLDDHAVAMQVRLALSLNRELKGSQIEAQAYRREVTLSGEVLRPEQKRLAVEIARETPNVSGVVDQIGVRGQPAPAGRRSDVERALAGNPNLAAYRLSVRDVDGRLVLNGRVRTGAEKELAGLIAREAAGGPVENAITIDERKASR